MSQKCVITIMTVAIVFVHGSNASPAKSERDPQDVGNLKLTFSNPGDVPSAFFDSPSEQRDTSAVAGSHEPRLISYRGCQDGSGGLCVPKSQCPAKLRPEISSNEACGNTEECCFGVPESDNSCKNRGGECVAEQKCGNGPKLRGTECSGVNGKVCCVWL